MIILSVKNTIRWCLPLLKNSSAGYLIKHIRKLNKVRNSFITNESGCEANPQFS